MMQCQECGFEAKTSQGLSSHVQAFHSSLEGTGKMLAAVEETLAELDKIGRFEPVDSARIEGLRSIAAALDSKPFNSQMWGEFRAALNEVMESDDEAEDGLAAALAEISSGT